MKLYADTNLQTAILPEIGLAMEAVRIARRHTARHGFRTYDLMHVASALLLGCRNFWSFDEKVRKLAALEGLQIYAPTAGA